MRVLRLPSALLASALVLGACGSKARPPLAGDYDGETTETPPPPATFSDPKPISCSIPQPGTCACVDVNILTDAPNLYFVLDRSGSMNDQNKWQTIRGVIGRLIRSLGPRAKFGAAVYPSPKTNSCTAGIEVMSVREGDPVGTYGATGRAFTSATNVVASGGTPTGPTLDALTPTIASLPGRSFVILATDGGPNCNDRVQCDSSQCIPNIDGVPQCHNINCCAPDMYGATQCLDAANSVGAVAGLAKAGVPTYVIGVPGSQAYADVLNDMATAGGTARQGSPAYYRVESADEDAMLAALKQVAAKIVATCTLKLGDQVTDPSLVNVYFDDVVVPRDETNGWRLDGSELTLVGTSCDRVMGGDVLSIQVVAGCPSVLR